MNELKASDLARQNKEYINENRLGAEKSEIWSFNAQISICYVQAKFLPQVFNICEVYLATKLGRSESLSEQE